MSKRFFIYFSLLFSGFAFSNNFEKDPNVIISELYLEISSINLRYEILINSKIEKTKAIDHSLLTTYKTKKKVDLLIQKDQINAEIRQLIKDNTSDVSKIRYIKGLQIIKILYEKVLSLDHHFASIRTFNEINKISNPNQYPEFEKLKNLVAAKKDKKTGLDLTSILGTNTIVSVIQTFTNMLNSSLTKDEKEKELSNIECILDFTLRMQNDLNTIYFETAFLQKSNDKMKSEIEILFKDYTKPINYTATLENCRTNDDWENVTIKMDEYLTKMKSTTGTQQYKMQVNLEFPIDRLLQFITMYNNFIDQGGKFYEKFKVILNSYENGKQCETKLPLEYKKLKTDIDVAIDKFNIAYKPVEINGTKMKEILYGLNEFD
ncbi:hypothetical protein G6N05_14785 [Flavobacterium sp. F372]|uniref:Uncharacterized protein n=1 Tax=Flavobacterium bernardetii TaxID=2813823 RepID=A0ABR7IZU0_9FLAO|nr:hypothetical protein [Flavobacterium bernardetii]MBC5835233.1 hypothetical protein [Flavobacterium bernardetii]NHF71378.1 hypothetical protein [Flavobacterium bernardetii]